MKKISFILAIFRLALGQNCDLSVLKSYEKVTMHMHNEVRNPFVIKQVEAGSSFTLVEGVSNLICLCSFIYAFPLPST